MKKKEKEIGSYLKYAGEIFKSNYQYDTFGYSVLRFFNYLFLILFIIGIFCSRFLKEEFYLGSEYLLLIFIASPTIASVIIYISKRKHRFIIWDKVEREKNESFNNKLIFFVCLFTYLSILVFSSTIDSFYKMEKLSKIELYSFSIRIFYNALFMANAIFSIQLCYFFYADDLIQDDFLADKPNNWEWDSRKL